MSIADIILSFRILHLLRRSVRQQMHVHLYVRCNEVKMNKKNFHAILELSKFHKIEIEENVDLYKFIIYKHDHSVIASLLKNHQYIFVDVIYQGKKSSIEHIEFYNNETENEVINELNDLVKLISTNSTRIISKNKLWGTLIGLEIFKEHKWARFGYSSNSK